MIDKDYALLLLGDWLDEPIETEFELELIAAAVRVRAPKCRIDISVPLGRLASAIAWLHPNQETARLQERVSQLEESLALMRLSWERD